MNRNLNRRIHPIAEADGLSPKKPRNDPNVIVDKDGWCNYSKSDIVAWIRNVTFDEILMINKDVLQRLKDK